MPEQRITLLQSLTPLSDVRREVELGRGTIDVMSEDTALSFRLTFGIKRDMAKPTAGQAQDSMEKSADERMSHDCRRLLASAANSSTER